MENLIAEFWL